MEKTAPAPILPVLDADTTVAEAIGHAELLSSRAVVEATEDRFRVHATSALRRLQHEGRGKARLADLDALEFRREGARSGEHAPLRGPQWGGHMQGTATHVAMAVSFTDFGIPPSAIVLGYAGAARVSRVVSNVYKCPVDGEKYSGGPGSCTLHDVALVPDD